MPDEKDDPLVAAFMRYKRDTDPYGTLRVVLRNAFAAGWCARLQADIDALKQRIAEMDDAEVTERRDA